MRLAAGRKIDRREYPSSGPGPHRDLSASTVPGKPDSVVIPEWTIVVDSREQCPLEFINQEPAGPRCLHLGDYSITGHEDRVAVERKSHADLLGSLTARRQAFEREIRAMAEHLDYYALVVEASMSDILRGHDRCGMLPKAAINSVLGWSVKYRMPVFFCAGRQQAQATIFNLLRFYWEYWGRPAGEA